MRMRKGETRSVVVDEAENKTTSLNSICVVSEKPVSTLITQGYKNVKLWYVLTFLCVGDFSSKHVAPNSTRNLDIFQLIHKYWIIRPMSVRSGSAVGECDSIQFASSFIIYVVDGLANTRHKNKTVFMMNGIIGIEVGNLWHPFTYLLSARRNNCCSKKLTIFLLLLLALLRK